MQLSPSDSAESGASSRRISSISIVSLNWYRTSKLDGKFIMRPTTLQWNKIRRKKWKIQMNAPIKKLSSFGWNRTRKIFSVGVTSAMAVSANQNAAQGGPTNQKSFPLKWRQTRRSGKHSNGTRSRRFLFFLFLSSPVLPPTGRLCNTLNQHQRGFCLWINRKRFIENVKIKWLTWRQEVAEVESSSMMLKPPARLPNVDDVCRLVAIKLAVLCPWAGCVRPSPVPFIEFEFHIFSQKAADFKNILWLEFIVRIAWNFYCV